MHDSASCPCGSGKLFSACCEPVIQNDSADSAEALMRSRYTAYVLGYWDYLRLSWHPHTRPSHVSPADTDWLGLTIVNATTESVEFIAAFRQLSNIMALHEISRFTRHHGHWRYIDGQCDISEAGRNAPCPCGSGKKTKHCCGHWQK